MSAAARTRDETRAAYHHGDCKRAVVDAALALVTEEQNWDFSLREVARRAGISHNAPYNHFADKRDLLAAVAAAGFEALRARMSAAAEAAGSPDEALLAIGRAYVRFGTENPAHYRLMFGPAPCNGEWPATAAEAAKGTKAVLDSVIWRGAEAGVFTPSPDDQPALEAAALASWSLVHGLTMLLIDKRGSLTAGSALCSEDVAGTVKRLLVDGLRRR